ncbi:HAD domain-containing protein [Aerolutibacter ruishenii]|uniref:FCP1 homology domain-containing protein n=1 Tax=Aerolutibacter ruishenii TaxID=686800 RepID=A0A562LGI0_9GAMM|nr:HAD domain-containing protein [Lysobacter ruishenii]TWI06711.1 hypothetical protein IP93_02934 [Lysobacter ruishenii]
MADLLFFLDFDDTLHPTWKFRVREDGREVAAPYDGPPLVHAPLLDALLAPYAERIEIVISSWWAYTRQLDTIRDMLPPRLAAQVVDSIWLDELKKYGAPDYRSHFATRYACIDLWLRRRRPNYAGPWLALDDDANSWPQDQRHHLVHAWGTLGQPRVQAELVAALQRELPTVLRRDK